MLIETTDCDCNGDTQNVKKKHGVVYSENTLELP